MVQVRGGGASGSHLAHGLSFQFDPVGVVDEPIQQGVGDGGVANQLVPGADGELAGDEHGAGVLAVLDDLEQQLGVGVLEPVQAPVVEDQQVGAASCLSSRARLPSAEAVLSSRSSFGTDQ